MIAIREMFAIAVSCETWGAEWAHKHVLFWCDNQGDVHSMLKGRSENDEIMHLLRVIALLAALHNFTYDIKWLPSETNVTADLATRVSLAEFQERCGHTYSRVAANLPPRSSDGEWEARLSARARAALLARQRQ